MQEEERQRQEIIKAKAVLSGPKAVGKIDLDPKKQEVKSEKPVSEEKPVIVSEEKPVVAEVKPVEAKVSEQVKAEVKEEIIRLKNIESLEFCNFLLKEICVLCLSKILIIGKLTEKERKESILNLKNF